MRAGARPPANSGGVPFLRRGGLLHRFDEDEQCLPQVVRLRLAFTGLLPQRKVIQDLLTSPAPGPRLLRGRVRISGGIQGSQAGSCVAGGQARLFGNLGYRNPASGERPQGGEGILRQ